VATGIHLCSVCVNLCVCCVRVCVCRCEAVSTTILMDVLMHSAQSRGHAAARSSASLTEQLTFMQRHLYIPDALPAA
jgi:hypothetical protein